MSERPSEYLKRTCLICGCHTNQTINIYEPRSGPNIVQLIQAKFKFQPLNEDKYLCFSCNNWLINWHSLQAVNSNDAENGAHLNSMPAQQKGAGAGAGNQANVTTVVACRPMALVKPMRTISIDDDEETSKAAAATSISSKQQSAEIIKAQTNKSKTLTTKRRKRFSRRNSLKSSYRRCSNTKRWQLRRRSKTLHKQVPIQARNATKIQQQQNREAVAVFVEPTTHRPVEYLKRPLVDGKIVAMLRRLGTSLTRETENTTLPPIMSPTKPKAPFTRPLEDDEILLSFDTAITEVLPPCIQMEQHEMQETDKLQHKGTRSQTLRRRRLSYSEAADCVGNNPKHSLLAANIRLPKSLVVSLV